MSPPISPPSSALNSNANSQLSSSAPEAESAVLEHRNSFAEYDCRYESVLLPPNTPPSWPLPVKLPNLDYRQALTYRKLGLIVFSSIMTGIAVGAVLVFTLPALTVPFCLAVAGSVLLTGGLVALGALMIIRINYQRQHQQQLEEINKQFHALKQATVNQLRAKQEELKINLLASAKTDEKAILEQANMNLQEAIEVLELKEAFDWNQTIAQKEKELSHNEPNFSQSELRKLQKSINDLSNNYWATKPITRYSNHWLQTQLEFFVLKQVDAYVDQIMDSGSDYDSLSRKIKTFLDEYRPCPVTPWVGERLAELEQLNEAASIWKKIEITSNSAAGLIEVQEKMKHLLPQNEQDHQPGKVNNFIKHKFSDYDWFRLQEGLSDFRQIDAYIDQIMDSSSGYDSLYNKIKTFLNKYRFSPMTPWVSLRLDELERLNDVALIWNQEKIRLDGVAISPEHDIVSNTVDALIEVREKMENLLSQNEQYFKSGKVNIFIKYKLDYVHRCISEKTATKGVEQLIESMNEDKKSAQLKFENESTQLKVTIQELFSKNQRLNQANQQLIAQKLEDDSENQQLRSENQQLHSDCSRLTNSSTESCRRDRKISSQSPSIEIQQSDEGSSDSTKMNLEPLFAKFFYN